MSTSTSGGRGDAPASASNETPHSLQRQGVPNRQPKVLLRPIVPRSVRAPRGPEAEKAIRRSLFQGLPKARRHFDPNHIEICVPPGFLSGMAQAPIEYGRSPSVLRSTNDETAALVLAPGQTPLTIIPPKPVTILAAGRVDPFSNYPIGLSSIDQWILDQLFTSPDPALRTFRESWLPIAVNDPAIFHQLLASVATRIRRLRGWSPGSIVSMTHHSLAIQAVNKRLSDPEHVKSDYAVASITILVCYSIVTEDFASFATHMEGLARIIQLRGGFEAVEQNATLRRIIFGVDVSWGYRQDLKPRFPLPEKLLRDTREATSNPKLIIEEPSNPAPWSLIFPTGHQLNDIFDEILTALNHAKIKSSRNEIWIRVEYATLWIDPISYRLLGMQANIDPVDPWSVIHEAARLGIILFFGEIRRKCGALAVSTLLHMKKLKALMSSVGNSTDWSLAQPLLLWVVFFGFFESWQQPEYDWYLGSMAQVAMQMNISSWDAVVATVRGFIWIGSIHDERLGKFRESFELALSQVAEARRLTDTSDSVKPT